jgi:hypothetical protein
MLPCDARQHPHRSNKITLLHQIAILNYFMRKMHGQTILKTLHSRFRSLQLAENRGVRDVL